MAVKEVNDHQFKESIASGVCVVDFFADWCGPCKMIAPIFKEISEEVSDKSFFKINVDDNQTTASNCGVTSLPTLVVFKDGKEVHRIVGFQKKEALLQTISKF